MLFHLLRRATKRINLIKTELCVCLHTDAAERAHTFDTVMCARPADAITGMRTFGGQKPHAHAYTHATLPSNELWFVGFRAGGQRRKVRDHKLCALTSPDTEDERQQSA